jgi:quercetin dioxygenase-like cupin family protein
MGVIKNLEEKFGEKPLSEVVYEDANAKVVRFYLKGGQEIKPHKSCSSVYITSLKGFSPNFSSRFLITPIIG